MRVMLATWAVPSHYFTMVGLGWALEAQGHEVRVVSPPGAEQAVLRSGLPLVVAGPKPDLGSVWKGFTFLPDKDSDPDEHEIARAARALEMFILGAETMVEDTVRFAEAWRPDLVLYDPRVYAALKAAEVVGVPAVRVLPGVDYTYAREDAERDTLAALWKRLGLAAADPYGALTLDPCPASLQVPSTVASQRMRFVPYSGATTLPVEPAPVSVRPRVFVTGGTLIGRVAGHLNPMHRLLDALSGLDIEVVLGIFSDQRELLGELPANTTVVEDMPLHLVLPSCDAIVHQGGAGTTLTAVSCGVPQATLPSVGDGLLNGRQLAAVGVGRNLRWVDAEPETIREQVASVVADGAYRAASERLRDENARQQTPADLVAVLEKTAVEGVRA